MKYGFFSRIVRPLRTYNMHKVYHCLLSLKGLEITMASFRGCLDSLSSGMWLEEVTGQQHFPLCPYVMNLLAGQLSSQQSPMAFQETCITCPYILFFTLFKQNCLRVVCGFFSFLFRDPSRWPKWHLRADQVMDTFAHFRPTPLATCPETSSAGKRPDECLGTCLP